MDKKILVIVAARGGSKGVKNKNIKDLCGKPLIAHTLTQAKQWGKATRLICSTDSQAIADVASQYGADIPFVRPGEMATDTAGKMDVLRHALKECEAIYGERYDIVIDLDVTAPVRRAEDIEGAFETFCRQHPDAVVSVVPARKSPYFNMLEEMPDGSIRLSKMPDRPILRRQDAPKVYDMNASIYVYDRNYILNQATRTGIQGRTLIWVMDELSAFDIDTEKDFIFVEYLVSKGLVTL